jgi:hypothetical protein
MNRYSSIPLSGRTIVTFFLLVAVPALVSQATMLGPVVPPTISISVDGYTGPNWEYTPAAESLERLPGQGQGHKLAMSRTFQSILGDRANVEVKQLEFDPDPFVLNNILVTNTTAVTQIFSAFVGLPTTFPGPNIISGTVRTDVIDGGGAPGATVATVPSTPIYAAQIDGVNVATLQNHSFSVVAPPANTASAPASFGPTVNAVPVTSNIGIQLRFSLSAGDTASLLSRFDVVAIPEPTTLALGVAVLLGAVAAGSARRR